MTELNLHPKQSNVRLRAYMSSALTNFPSPDKKEGEKIREFVNNLNTDIKKLCDRLNVTLYLPQESSNPASDHDDGLNPDEVYFLDRWRIAESNFLILNAEYLSFGVGQEMEIANSIGVPSIIFFKKGARVSRMILGAPCIFVPDGFQKSESYIQYDNIEDLFSQLSQRIDMLRSTLKFDSQRMAKTESFSKRFRDAKKSKKLSNKELSELTGLSNSFLKLLETDNNYFKELATDKDLADKKFIELDSENKFTNPGLYILERLSKALEIELHQLLPSPPNLISYSFVDIYKEALIETKPTINQLLEINKSLNFEFHRKVAAFDGDSSMSKEIILEEIRAIMSDEEMV